MKKKVGNWVPLGFCASLSFICVICFISGSPTSGIIPFLCFLPMCFFFVAAVTSDLQREIRELREQVEVMKRLVPK